MKAIPSLKKCRPWCARTPFFLLSFAAVSAQAQLPDVVYEEFDLTTGSLAPTLASGRAGATSTGWEANWVFGGGQGSGIVAGGGLVPPASTAAFYTSVPVGNYLSLTNGQQNRRVISASIAGQKGHAGARRLYTQAT